MNSLSSAGKFTLGSGGGDTLSAEQLFGKLTYEEKVKSSEKDFVSGKSNNVLT